MCPVGESVGGCGARAVSRKTNIYFIRIHVCLSILICECDDDECVR